jgi:hypothetical protein
MIISYSLRNPFFNVRQICIVKHADLSFVKHRHYILQTTIISR